MNYVCICFLLLIGFIFPFQGHAQEDSPVRAQNVFYIRHVDYKKGPGLWTENLLDRRRFDSGFRTELGAALGEKAGVLSNLTYKLQAETPVVAGHFSVLARWVQNHDRTVDHTDSIFMSALVVRGSLTEHFRYTANGGIADRSATGWQSAFLARLSYLRDVYEHDYELTFANFDVFDIYPVTQPFFQLQTEMPFLETGKRVYGYLRYRFNDNPSHPYATYVAVGVNF